METHYYNAFDGEDGYWIESKAMDFDQMLQDIRDSSYPYIYTIQVSDQKVQRLDFEMTAMNLEYDNYEKLTGHEHGTNPGRV